MLRECFDRELKCGDFVVINSTSSRNSSLCFGIVMSDSEVFTCVGDCLIYKPYKPTDRVLLIEKEDYNEIRYNTILEEYKKYMFKATKSVNDMENLKVGDVLENLNAKNDYAIYLGLVNIKTNKANEIHKLNKYCYIKLDSSMLENNGFMKSIYSGTIQIKLRQLLFKYLDDNFSYFHSNSRELMTFSKLNQNYTLKVGHVNLLYNSKNLLFEIKDKYQNKYKVELDMLSL